MQVSVDKIYEQAMRLSDESKADLAERIVEYLETHAHPELERLHLDIVKRRKEEIRSKQVELIDAKDVLSRARKILEK